MYGFFMHWFTDGPTIPFLLRNHAFLTVFIMLIAIGCFIDDTQVLFEADDNVLQCPINVLGKSVPRLFDEPVVISFIVCLLLVAQ